MTTNIYKSADCSIIIEIKKSGNIFKLEVFDDGEMVLYTDDDSFIKDIKNSKELYEALEAFI